MSFSDVEGLSNKMIELEQTLNKVVDKIDKIDEGNEEFFILIDDLNEKVERLKTDKLDKDDFEITLKKINIDLENITRTLDKNDKRDGKIEDKLDKIQIGQDKLFKFGVAGVGSLAVVCTILGNITGTKIDILSIFMSILGIGG